MSSTLFADANKAFVNQVLKLRPKREKRAEVSKAQLKAVLKKHEARETPEQEAAESEDEQRVEREAGVEKKAFWAGFEKAAKWGFPVVHHLDPKTIETVNKLRPSKLGLFTGGLAAGAGVEAGRRLGNIGKEKGAK